VYCAYVTLQWHVTQEMEGSLDAEGTAEVTDSNIAIARRLMDEVWGHGQVELLDEIMVEDVIDHGAEGQSGGRQAVKDAVRMIRGAFPDLQTVESDIVAQGDKVVRRWVNEGTHAGSFLGLPPTGNHIRVTGINIERIVGGRIVEYWHNFDMLGWLEQLGVAIPIQLPSSSSFAAEATE